MHEVKKEPCAVKIVKNSEIIIAMLGQANIFTIVPKLFLAFGVLSMMWTFLFIYKWYLVSSTFI